MVQPCGIIGEPDRNPTDGAGVMEKHKATSVVLFPELRRKKRKKISLIILCDKERKKVLFDDTLARFANYEMAHLNR